MPLSKFGYRCRVCSRVCDPEYLGRTRLPLTSGKKTAAVFSVVCWACYKAVCDWASEKLDYKLDALHGF